MEQQVYHFFLNTVYICYLSQFLQQLTRTDSLRAVFVSLTGCCEDERER